MQRKKQVVVTLPYYQDAILRYYANKYQRDMVDIMRTMIPMFARADDKFKPDEYQKFVRDSYLSFLEGLTHEDVTPEVIKEIDQQVRDFLADDYDQKRPVFMPANVHTKTATKARNKSKATPKSKARKSS